MKRLMLGIFGRFFPKVDAPTMFERPKCIHEPLEFKEDGSPVEGTKRCKHCGLNKAYWSRT